MNIFESPFSKNTCGSLPILSGKSGDMQLMMIDKNNQSCNVKLLHDRDLEVDSGGNFTTVSEKISCSLSINTFVLYLNKPSSYSWVLENSVTINIYNFKTNKLLATTVIGKQDSIVRLGVSKYKDKPSIVLSKCDPDIDFDLNDEFVKIEIVSMCDQNASPCCDSLPTQVSVSGYSTLCIPLNEFYTIPDYPPITTTPAPYSAPAPTISLLDDLAVKQSSGIPYYVVDAHVSTSDGSDFSYWWERSENNSSWQRITDLKTEKTETLVALKEVKRRDYYYRLYFDSPEKKRSNVAFFDYPDPAPTTTTSTTTAAPLVHPNSPTNVDASGGGFRQVHLSWNAPVEDERAPVSGYRILANTIASTSPYSSDYAFKTEVSASTTGYFQPVAQLYDGITLHYCVSAANFFGFSEVACDSAATISTEPPTVSNLVVTPDDTGGVEGFFLNWDTGGVNEVYPLVSHKIRHRTSGTADTYSVINYPVAELSVTQVKVTGLFDNCEQIEFLVDAESTIGFSTVPATGYGLYGFLPHSPTNLSLALQDAGGGNVNIDLGWTEPTDSGRCDVIGYVYNYRLAGTLDWGFDVPLTVAGATPDITPVTTNPNTYSIQTNAVPSGDYEARIAAITVVGTGSYGAISAATLVKLDFEEWIQNTGVDKDHLYSIPNNSAYTSWAHIDTHPTSVGDDGGDALYNRSNAAKFGNFGLYGGSEAFNNGITYFTCPVMRHVSAGSSTNAIYPSKVGYVIFDGDVDSWSEKQTGAQGSTTNPYYKSLTNSVTPLNLDGDGETRYTLETWFKLNDIDTTWTNANLSMTDSMGLLSLVTVPDSKFFNTTNFANLSENCGGGFNGTGFEFFQGGFDESLGFNGGSTYAYVFLKGDFISGSGLRLKIEQSINSVYGNNSGDNIEVDTASSSMEILAPHPNYINDTEWHHIAIVGSGNNLKLYVDGTGIIDHDTQHSIRIFYGDGVSEDTYIPATGFDHTSQFGYLVFNQTHDNVGVLYDTDGYESIDGYCNYFDEIRLTKTVAYTGNFPVPTEPLI